MNIKPVFLTIFMSFISIAHVAPSHAALIKFEFSGVFNETSSLFNSGDTFSGAYTFETTAPTTYSTVPNDSIKTYTYPINAELPGTTWNLDVYSSAIPTFSLSGSYGSIYIGDNTIYGDRYITTLNGLGVVLPGGLSLNFFQIDLIDFADSNPDLLSNGNIDVLPDITNTSALSIDNGNGGRFWIIDETSGCTQCGFSLTSLTVAPVPIPASAWLFFSGLLSLLFTTRRKST